VKLRWSTIQFLPYLIIAAAMSREGIPDPSILDYFPTVKLAQFLLGQA
jgi:hypothetical protein